MVLTLPRTAEEFSIATGSRVSAARERIEARLELEYEHHSERLASLLVAAGRKRAHQDHPGLAAAILTGRRALADVAQALRRIAEGSYGRCERCREEISVEQLELAPLERWCGSCGPEPLF